MNFLATSLVPVVYVDSTLSNKNINFLVAFRFMVLSMNYLYL
jgi:hypothetical protein